MPKTVFTGAHTYLVDVLIQARKQSGLTQTELALRLGKDQKFISLIESAQRRVDVLEFFAIGKALGLNPVDLFTSLASILPEKIDI